MDLRHPVTLEPLDLSKARARKKVKKVLGWCVENLSETEAVSVHSDTINRVFGPVSNRLANHLRTALLDRFGSYVVGVRSFQYQLQPGSVQTLMSQISSDLTPAEKVHLSRPSAELHAERIERQHAEELASKNFQYDLKSDRYWNSLQHIKRDLKPAFWSKHGLPYDYDIEACAPTILYQTALSATKHAAPKLAVRLKPIRDYLSDRAALRTHVAALTGLPAHEAKRLINSMFNGVRIVNHPTCSIMVQLQEAGMTVTESAIVIERLRRDPVVRALRLSIRSLWSWIRLTHPNRRFSNGSAKAGFYYERERRVLDAITRFLDEHGCAYFKEHDGFRTDRPIDVSALTEAIRRQTGYSLLID